MYEKYGGTVSWFQDNLPDFLTSHFADWNRSTGHYFGAALDELTLEERMVLGQHGSGQMVQTILFVPFVHYHFVSLRELFGTCAIKEVIIVVDWLN